MEIPPIDPVQSSHASAVEEGFNDPQFISQTLDQIFQQDRLKESNSASPIASPEPTQPSFWELFLSFFWKKPEVNKSAALPSPETEIKAAPLKPLSAIPAIDKPEGTSFTWTPSTDVKEAKQTVSLSWVKEGLSLMSSSTIEALMFIILRRQLESEKENAEAVEKTFTNQEKAQQLKEKILEEVKEALAKDEKVAGYFKTAQALTIAAGVVSAMAIAIVFAPAGAGIGAAGTALIKYGAATLTLINGFKTALETYFQTKGSENKASFERARHASKIHEFRMEELHQHIMAVAETDSSFKEALLQETKRVNKMLRSMLQK